MALSCGTCQVHGNAYLLCFESSIKGLAAQQASKVVRSCLKVGFGIHETHVCWH